MFSRKLTESLQGYANFPAIAILGPRQSGKTTLAKTAFPHHAYINLEDIDARRTVIEDPKGFLAQYKNSPGIIIDEFQNFPDLLSYIQLAIDETYRPNFFILTGSQNFLMNQAISQSLAGRIGILTLLPLSIEEFKKNKILPERSETLIFNGSYPRIYDQKIDPIRWYPSYINTYIERDVRDLKHLTQLDLFRKFLGMCAGRIGQPINLSSLGNDVGISHSTVQAWLTILEASYIIFRLQPYFGNFGKRLIKTPKLYFYDTGLACSLLQIPSETQLYTHYLRGNLFENLIISNLIKQSYNHAHRPHIYFWQDSQRHEVDCLVDHFNKIIPIEIKAGQTLNPDFFTGLDYWNSLSGGKGEDSYVIYGGKETQNWPKAHVVSWENMDEIIKY